MPSPVGHVIAGAAIGWAAEALPPLRARLKSAGGSAVAVVTPLAAACALLALAPDADILLASHRTYTHSIAAVALVGILSAAVARARGGLALATGMACAAAVGSHIVLDWLGHDASPPIGLMALWPLSAAYVYSGLDVFADVSRRYWKPDEIIFKNAVSIAREIAILVPFAAAAFWMRRRSGTRSQFPTGSGAVTQSRSRATPGRPRN